MSPIAMKGFVSKETMALRWFLMKQVDKRSFWPDREDKFEELKTLHTSCINARLSPSCLNEVKQSLVNWTTGSDRAQSLSVVLVYLCMRGIPLALRDRVYLSVWREEGALGVESLAVFVPSCPHPLVSTVYQCDGSLSSRGRGGSWLGCQVLPAIGAVWLPIMEAPGCLGHPTSTKRCSCLKEGSPG